MLRTKLLRILRMAALVTMVSLAAASVAWGQSYGRYDDDDYYRHNQASEQGFRNGYHDGLSAGQHDRDRGRRFKFKTDDWEDAHGFEHWMGNHDQYKHAYREGYERGYRRGYGDHRNWDDYRWRDRDDWR